MENHILFYSNYCANCKEFIQSLYKSPFFEKFQKICVDKNPKIPKEIQSVPCIIVPRITKPLVGTEAFHWLRGMNQIHLQEQEKSENNKAANQAHYKPEPAPKAEGQTGDPTNLNYAMGAVTAYSGTMGGFSDNYSFIGTDAPMEHSFSFLGDKQANIPTPQEGDPRSAMESSSSKKNDMDKDFERLVAMRNNEIPKPIFRQ